LREPFAFSCPLSGHTRGLLGSLLLHDPQNALLGELAAGHDVSALFGSHARLIDSIAPSSQAWQYEGNWGRNTAPLKIESSAAIGVRIAPRFDSHHCRLFSLALFACSESQSFPEAPMLFTANRRALLAGLSSALIVVSLTPVFAAGKAKMQFDTDNDGTLDLNEVKAAAGAAFDKLDRDHDGTLDKKELRGRISKDMMGDADPDNDGTISKDEYVGLAEKLFKEADGDGEGTLDAKELRSKAGRQLMKLLK
jgi:hypothetical protein